MKLTPIPTKVRLDWQALADLADLAAVSKELLCIPTGFDVNAAHASLHRRGYGLKRVMEDKRLVAYQLRPLTPKVPK